MTEDRDTSWTDEPVCPHCGYVETDSWEIDFGGDFGSETESTCDSCGEEYFLRRHCVVTYEYSSYSKALGKGGDE